MNTKVKSALSEAFVDTALGTLVNVPLNYVLVYLAFSNEWSPLLTTLIFTCTFFTLGITRKVLLRLSFQKRLEYS